MRSIALAERCLLVSVSLVLMNTLFTRGVAGLMLDVTRFFRSLPGVEYLLTLILRGEVKGALSLLAGPTGEKKGKKDGSEDANAASVITPIPEKGIPLQQIESVLKSLKISETTAEEGKSFAYTYTTETFMPHLSTASEKAFKEFSESSGLEGTPGHDELLKQVWSKFMNTNALNPMMYPSLRRFEVEIIGMTTWMLNGDVNTRGSVTSGGTESILMAIKSYRDRARKLRPDIVRPNMVVPTTIHPAFEKAAHYFDVEVKHVEIGKDCRVDMALVEKAVDSNTILLVGSAPQYCHAVVDPIEALSDLAIRKGLPLHVDACFGGFMLPWMERVGANIPLWDFRVPGVTSMSADIHKYGYASKGASVLLWKNEELRSFQYFAYSEWPGGLFCSPSMSGSRPGGVIAAAWAAMVTMGQDGYTEMARKIYATTKELQQGIEKIDGIKCITKSDMTAFAIISTDKSVNILVLADKIEKNGWKMERQQLPDTLHFSIMPQHVGKASILLNDLEDAVKSAKAKQDPNDKGSAGVYGMIGTIPDKSIVDDFLVMFFSQLYSPGKEGDTLIENYSKK